MRHPAVTAAAVLALALCSCATTADGIRDVPQRDSLPPAGELRFSGTVAAVDNSCQFDGVCTVSVDGIVVTTMSGERLNAPVWGQSSGQPQVGQRVAVYCLHTGLNACTLKGNSAYFLRPLQ